MEQYENKKNNKNMKIYKSLLIILFSVFLANVGTSQKLLQSIDEQYQNIGEQYAKKYFAPLTTGIGVIMGSGFIGGYSPQEYKKVLISPHIYIGMKYCGVVKTEDESTFNFNFKSHMNYMGISVPVIWSVKNAPTIFGNTNPAIASGTFYFNGQKKDTVVKLIGGSGTSSLTPLYIPHIGIGTFLGTDFIIRGFPGFNIGSYGRLTIYGGAIRHNFSTYIKMPFDVSLQGGFQHLYINNSDYRFMTGNSYFFNIQFNKRFSFLSVYAGTQIEGYNIDVNYEYDGIKLPFTQKSDNPFRALLGLTFSLGPVKINSDISYGEKFSFSGGIGMGLY